MPYPLTQNMLFVILTSPGPPAGSLFSLFFGWWAESGVDTSALWDHYQVSCIRVAARGDEAKEEGRAGVDGEPRRR
jgi:hypothetical protein